MKQYNFDPNSLELVQAWSASIEKASQKLDFDVRCLDWFSYNPDFFIEQRDRKAA